MVLLYNLFEGVTSMPELPDLFRASNPPKQVRFSVIECFSGLSFCALADSRFLWDDLLVYRSDPSLLEVHRLSHMMPSTHLQPHDYRPDLDSTVSETLSSSDSDDRATLAD